MGGHLYRLRNKRKSMEAIPPIAIQRVSAGTPLSNSPDLTYYKSIAAGETVTIVGGDIPAAHKVSESSTPFDYSVRGETEVLPTPPVFPPFGYLDAVPTAGTLHVNGGVFSHVRHDNAYGVGPLVEDTWLVIKPPSSTAITGKYGLGWSEAVGFPSCGSSHQGRVIFAGFEHQKRVVVGSVLDDPRDFSIGGASSDGFHFLVNDLRGSRVRWLSSGVDLLIGTTTGEFSIGGSPLSALSVGVDRHSAYGSASIRPVIIGNHLLFVQKDRKTIRALKFNFATQRYQSTNATQNHAHLFKDVVIEEMVVWEGEEDPVLLLRLSNGEVLSSRVNEIEGFIGWSRMKLPLCSSICQSRHPIPSGESTSYTAADSFYVAYDTSSANKYALSKYDDTLYLDEAEIATVTGTFATSNYAATLGSTRFNGLDVSVVVDGIYRGEHTVTGSSVSLVNITSAEATSVIVGKKINMVMHPRVPEVISGTRVTSTLGRMKNYSSVVVNVNGSKGVKVNGLEIDGIPLDLTSNQITPHTEHTGWLECVATGLYGIQPLLEISSDRPYPVEICGYTVDMKVEG